jgi:hypothetical protein
MEQGKAGSMEAMRNEGETANKAMSLQSWSDRTDKLRHRHVPRQGPRQTECSNYGQNGNSRCVAW